MVRGALQALITILLWNIVIIEEDITVWPRERVDGFTPLIAFDSLRANFDNRVLYLKLSMKMAYAPTLRTNMYFWFSRTQFGTSH